MTWKRGLVVGKFAPLHRGHEHLIRRALADCDEVIVVSWTNPDIPGCETAKRDRWIAALFPEVRRLVLEEGPGPDEDERVHRRFTGNVVRERLGVEVDAVFTSESYGDGFADELTALYREAAGPARNTPPGTSQRRPVAHVCVDAARSAVPITASTIREDVHAHRAWLAPAVYADFVERVVLLGGESSGKSTLALALAKHFRTASVPEYGRELWEQKDGALVFEDLLQIAERQVELERAAALGAHRYLFCDTSPLTTLFYSDALFGRADPRLVEHAQRAYDHVVLCSLDVPFVQDGTRQEPGFRERQHAWYVEQLSGRGIPWIEVGGSVEERIERVARALG